MKLPNLLHYLTGKMKGLTKSNQLSEDAVPLTLSRTAAAHLQKEWKQILKPPSKPSTRWTKEELQLIQRIQSETKEHNLNNVTRTSAYLRIYQAAPEVHWALLAHMVSRNGGYSMTDLRSEYISKLVSSKDAEAIFRFLESANMYIFHDAYPQLRLYELSRLHKRNLMHLLPAFGVSAFMIPVWAYFWQSHDSVALTIALIINEQHYIEGRIVRDPWFIQHVLEQWLFTVQRYMQLNQVIFPYLTSNDPHSLVGLILEDFSSLKERIEFGKSLYTLLFGMPQVQQGILQFAQQQPHTGSRADYWTQLFSRIRKAPPSESPKERLDGLQLKQGAAPLYSPSLQDAWPNAGLQPPGAKDWFISIRQTHIFQTPKLPSTFEMTHEHALGLKKIELAALAQAQLLR